MEANFRVISCELFVSSPQSQMRLWVHVSDKKSQTVYSSCQLYIYLCDKSIPEDHTGTPRDFHIPSLGLDALWPSVIQPIRTSHDHQGWQIFISLCIIKCVFYTFFPETSFLWCLVLPSVISFLGNSVSHDCASLAQCQEKPPEHKT